jgi:hypothetical protein
MTKVTLTYGIIYALASLLWISMEYALGFQTIYVEIQPYVTFLFLFPAVYIMFRGMKSHRRIVHERQAPFNYFMAFMSGFNITVIATLLSPVVSYIFHSFINPEFFDTMIQQSVQSMLMTEDMAKAYYNQQSYIQQSILGGLISGSVISATLALFLRDKSQLTENSKL